MQVSVDKIWNYKTLWSMSFLSSSSCSTEGHFQNKLLWLDVWQFIFSDFNFYSIDIPHKNPEYYLETGFLID